MKKPLAGRSVLITRPKAASGPVAAALRRQGARVIVSPLIRIAKPRSYSAVDRALRSFGRYHAVVFTSANAVESFFARSKSVLKRIPDPPAMICAVGNKTSESVAVLTRGSWKVSTLPENAQNSAALAKVLRVPRGKSVLIPRAERGLDTVPSALRNKGVLTHVVSVYKTVPDETGRKIFRRALALGADVAVFASPSAARAGGSDIKLSGAKAVAIGPTTAAALRSLKIVPVVSKNPSPRALVQAVVLAARSLP